MQVANHPWLRGDVPESTPTRHQLISVSVTELNEAVSVTLRADDGAQNEAQNESGSAKIDPSSAPGRESVDAHTQMSAAEEQLRTQIFMSKSDALFIRQSKYLSFDFAVLTILFTSFSTLKSPFTK